MKRPWFGVERSDHILLFDLEPHIHEHHFIQPLAKNPLETTALLNEWVWIMEPDTKAVVNETAQVEHDLWFSKIATKRLAIIEAGNIPMAIPLSCLTMMTPNHMWLLSITRVSASRSALGENPYLLEISGEERYSERRAIH
jgi:hypothetical protein